MATDVEALLLRIDASTEGLRREMRRAEQQVGNSSKRMEREVRRFDRGMERLQRTAQTAQRALGALGVALSVRGLQQFATSALQAADSLQQTADRVGLTVTGLQQFRFAAGQVGIASNTLDMAMQRLTRRFGEAASGKGELIGVLEEFNIAIHDSEGRMRTSEAVVMDLADAIASAKSPAEQLRIAFKAFDSEGAALVNVLRNGSEGMRRFMREAEELGLVMDEDLVRAAGDVNTQLQTLNQTVRTQVQQGFLRVFVDDFGDLREIAKDKDFQLGLDVIGTALGKIARAFTGTAENIGQLAGFFRDLDGSKLGEFFEEFLRKDPLGGWIAGGIDARNAEAQMERLLDVSQKLVDARQRLAELEQADYMPNLSTRLNIARGEVAELEAEFQALQAAFDPMNDAAAETSVILDTISVTADDIEDTTSNTASNVAEISEHEKAILAALESATAAREQHAEDVARTLQDLERQVALGEIELQYLGDQTGELEVQRRLYEIRNQLGERAARQAEPYLRQLQKQTQEIRAQEEAQRRFSQVVDDTVRYGSDLFADLFRETSDGWRGMWDNMRQTMISMLARMAAEAALRPIVVSVLGAMGVAGAGAAAGAAGIGGAGGGGMFGLGNLSDLSSIFNASGGSMMPGVDAWAQANLGFGSIGEMARPTAGFIGPMPAQTAGLLNGGSAMAGFASLGNVLGIAGSALPGLMSGNYAQAGLGTAGAAIGTALLPGIGTAVGGFLGNVVGSLFGGGGNTDQQIRPYSHALGTGKGVETPFREFRNSAHRFDGGPLQNAIVEADKAIAAALSDRAIEQVRDYFDLAGTIKGTKRDNKELGPKHFARFIRDSFTDMMEALGGTAAREGFGRMASGLGNDPDAVLELAQQAATFLGNLADNRLFKPQEVSQLEAAWDALNEQGEEFKRLAAELGQPVEEVMRQLREAQQAFRDEIQQGYQDQIDAMLRPAELAWRQLREAQVKEIEELEKVGASTAKAQQWHQLQIRALFEQNYELQRMYLEGLIDLGDDLNAQLGALWGIVSTGIDSLIQGSTAAYQEAVRLGRQYAQINRGLQQTIHGLRVGPQSPLSLEEQFLTALDQFRATLGEALAGDGDAAQQLQQLVNPVLDLASQFFGSTEGYAQIFDEVISGLEMAGVAMETQAGGFAALASALDAQIDILNEINDVLNQRDELGEDFESRYNKLTSELEDVGYTIGGINAFLQDAADAIPTTIVTAFASGLDSAQLAKRMGELFQATVTATEQAMRDGVENIGAAIDGAQQALLRGWIPDFIELAEQFNGAIPEIRFDRVTARAVAHYEASADQLGSGLRSAVAQVQFDGLQQAIYTAQELVGDKFDAAVGGISFEGIDGALLAMTLHDGITGVAEAAQVSLNGQAQRIEGVIDRTLEAFTLDATRATILDSVDIINNGATEVRLAFGRVEGALLRLSNNADGHITALIDEVDTAIARFTNWGAGSLRVGVESLRAGLLDVRNAGEGALELWADTVEARETRISNLGPGALAARINSLRGQLVNVRNAGAGLLEFWADTVESRATVIENIDRGNLRAAINDLRGGIVTVRNLSRGHLQFWANRVKADTVRIENIDRGDLRAIVNDLRAGILTIRNHAAGHLEFWADRVEAGETRIENVGRGDLMAFVTTLRSGLVSVRNHAAGHLQFWANRVEAGETRIENIGRGDLSGAIGTLRSALVTIRNLGSGRLEFWAETLKAQETRIENLGSGTLVAFVDTLRSSLVTILNAGQGRLEFWADVVEAQETLIENLNAGTLVARINDLRSDLLTIRNAGEGALLFWADTVEAQEARISNLGAGNLVARINDLRAELVTIRNAGQGRLNFWARQVDAQEARILNIADGNMVARINDLRAGLLDIRNAGQGRLLFWADTVEAREAAISGLDAGSLVANANDFRARLLAVRNAGQGRLAFWRDRVEARLQPIKDLDIGNIVTNINSLRSSLVSTRNTAQQRLSQWQTAVQKGLDRIANLSNDLGGGAIAAELKKIVENRLPKRFGDAIDRAFEDVFGVAKPVQFFANMSSLVGSNSALVTSLRSLAQTIQMSAENAEQIRRGRVDTYAQGVKGSVQDALGAGVAAGSRTVTDYISNPVYRDGNLAGYDMIKTEKQVRDDSNRRAPLEAALGEIAAHFQQMLGLGNLPKRTLKVDDGTPYFEQLAIAGYGSVATKKLNDMRTMASFMLDSYADWAMKGDRVSAEARKLLDGRNWGPGNVQNALANLAKSLGYAGMLPSFAAGGYHTGGLALVGEQGPELVDFASPSRIYSAPDTSRIMAGFANDNGSFRELIAEVRALRAENAELRRTVSEGFGDTVQAEGVSGTAIRAEIRGLREDVEELQTATRQQQRRASA